MKVSIHNTDRCYKYNFQTVVTGIIGVYGISGSGKSSLLDAIAGYDEQIKGKIEFLGKSLTGVIPCAYMSQHPILFEHWTIRQNLEFVKQYHSIAYDKFIQCLNCTALLDKYPRQLSGGEKQRIVFIRTLIQIKNGTLVLLAKGRFLYLLCMAVSMSA
jgi:ABC-type molybdate transport system ATPase subunit